MPGEIPPLTLKKNMRSHSSLGTSPAQWILTPCCKYCSVLPLPRRLLWRDEGRISSEIGSWRIVNEVPYFRKIFSKEASNMFLYEEIKKKKKEISACPPKSEILSTGNLVIPSKRGDSYRGCSRNVCPNWEWGKSFLSLSIASIFTARLEWTMIVIWKRERLQFICFCLSLECRDRRCWDYLSLPPIKVYHLFPQDLTTQKLNPPPPCHQALQANDTIPYCGHPISSLSVFV